MERNGQAMDLPMVPELAPTDNYGQIGVKLLANAEIRHRCHHPPMVTSHLLDLADVAAHNDE